MKKILLSLFLMTSLGLVNPSQAQCNGASVSVTNFAIIAPGNQVNYAFDWTYVNGNASIQVMDSCNGVLANTAVCIPRLTDSAAGPHHVTGSFPTTCSGALTVAVIIWSNPNCGGNGCTAVSRTITHIALPVIFKSFTATRNHSNVLVKWETATEQNCSGFAVERNTNGGWQQVAFVPSQARGGLSDVALAYSYNDLNATKGITQYRFKEVDFDSKSIYSDTRSVRGEGQIGQTIVYPNPTDNGKVSVVFEDGSTARDVSLTDMSGRIVKQWKGITNNNLQIENLNPGMYSLRVIVPETGEQVVEKIIVNKR